MKLFFFFHTNEKYLIFRDFNFSKRPYAEECHEHRWLVSSDYMIKKRERAVFLGNRLRVCLIVSFCRFFVFQTLYYFALLFVF